MDLLFKREQTSGELTRVRFKLWGKIELDEEEQALTKRYQLDDAVLIAVVQPNLLRQGILAGFVGFIPAAFIFSGDARCRLGRAAFPRRCLWCGLLVDQ